MPLPAYAGIPNHRLVAVQKKSKRTLNLRLATAMLKLTLPFVLFSISYALPLNSVGKLPSLGWNSWNAYACTRDSRFLSSLLQLKCITTGSVDETKIVSAANQIVSLGLKDAGYMYVNIDVSSGSFPSSYNRFS
jgi:hypothetical protein